MRPDTLRGWIRKVKNGVKLHGNKGRPSALSKEGKEKLVEYCTAGVYNVKYEDFIKKIHELQMEEAASYKKGLTSVKLMAESFIQTCQGTQTQIRHWRNHDTCKS